MIQDLSVGSQGQDFYWQKNENDLSVDKSHFAGVLCEQADIWHVHSTNWGPNFNLGRHKISDLFLRI